MFDCVNRNAVYFVSKFAVFSTSFFTFQLSSNAQVVDLNAATISGLCTNANGANALYQVTLKSDFKGGIVHRMMVQDFFPPVARQKIDDGPRSFVRSVVGEHKQAVDATAYKVRGAFTAIRTSPRLGIGVLPVPQVEFSCSPPPTPSDNSNGNNAGNPNFRCPIGQYPWGINGACVYSSPSLAYSSNQLIASSHPMQLNIQTQHLTDHTIDVVEWEGVRWQNDLYQ